MNEINQGTVSIEQSRSIAEVQSKIIAARSCPRDESKAYENIMETCSRKSFAESATYKYPRGGQSVSGPSIRLAEEIARCWGNIEYGTKELSRKAGSSEMLAFAWDQETNTSSTQTFTVNHIRESRSGNTNLKSERDVYEVTANNGSRRLRARILALIPDHIIQDAIARCRQTIAGNSNEPIADRVKKMIAYFEPLGVKSNHISEFLKIKTLDDIMIDHIADLTEVVNSIKQGHKPSEFFNINNNTKIKLESDNNESNNKT